MESDSFVLVIWLCLDDLVFKWIIWWNESLVNCGLKKTLSFIYQWSVMHWNFVSIGNLFCRILCRIRDYVSTI